MEIAFVDQHNSSENDDGLNDETFTFELIDW